MWTNTWQRAGRRSKGLSAYFLILEVPYSRGSEWDLVLDILQSIIEARGPLLICVQNGLSHKLGRLPLGHLKMETLPEVLHGGPAAETGKAALGHQGDCGDDWLSDSAGLKAF